MRAREVLELLDSPPLTELEIDEHLRAIANYPEELRMLPGLDAAIEESLLHCAIFIALEREQAEYCRSELRRLLGPVNYQFIVSLIAYIKTCHTWMEAYPEVAYQYEIDKRSQDYLSASLEEEPGLAEFFQNYVEKVRLERQSWRERLAAIAERKRNQEALRQANEQLQAVLDTVPGLISWVNMDGEPESAKTRGDCSKQNSNIALPELRYRGVNQHIATMFNLPREEFMGQPIGFLEKTPQFTQIMHQFFADSAVATSQEIAIAVNGKSRNYLVAAQKYQQGKAAVAVGIDITQQKQLEAELRKALLQEQELSELKSRFVATTSHEFRTPLTTILSSAELLGYYSHEWGEEKKLKHIHRIQKAVARMTQLLDDVLLIGKAEAGKLEFKPAPLDLEQFCLSLVEEFQLKAPVCHDISSQAPVTFVNRTSDNRQRQNLPLLDEKLLRHILSNLLSNAMKYSPEGSSVQLELAVCQEVAILQVSDRGIGIPSEDLPRLFDSFHRATNVGQIPGTGLGLAIVKNAVDLHRGKIVVNSQVGVGTTFTVTLPLK